MWGMLYDTARRGVPVRMVTELQKTRRREDERGMLRSWDSELGGVPVAPAGGAKQRTNSGVPAKRGDHGKRARHHRRGVVLVDGALAMGHPRVDVA